MAISLASLQKVRATSAPRIVIYGAEGDGKTSAAASFPNPVFIQTEVGTPSDLELTSFGKIEKFSDVMDAISALYGEEHDFQTLVIDSVSALQPLIFAETCERGDEKGVKKSSIEDFPYGKGYVFAQRVLAEFMQAINALREHRNMTIILIAHARITKFDDPETQSYDRYELDMHAKLAPILSRDMDAILLIKKSAVIKTEDAGFNKSRAIADGGGMLWTHTESRPAYVAKNRFGMPSKIRFEKGKFYTTVEEFFPKKEQE
jgi:hypothetical protein